VLLRSAWSACSASRGFPRPPRAEVAAWQLPSRAASAAPHFQSLAHVCAGDACMFLPDLRAAAAATNASDAPPLPLVLPALPRLLTTQAAADAPSALRRCATRDGTHAEARAVAASLATAKPPEGGGGVFVRVVWTVVHSGDAGKLTRAAIEAQIAHLNAAWGGVSDTWSAPEWDTPWRPDTPRATGVFFTLADVIYREDAAFFAGCSPATAPAKSAAWNVDTRHSMNVYSCTPTDDLLGWTSFPADMEGEEDGARGAVFVRWDTLPTVAPSSSKYGLGNTLVHEAGHYMGLFHVFQGASCSGDAAAGDGVADTAPQETPTYGSCAANAAKASCPPGLDGIQNFMDYSEDACMKLFTPQQIQARHDACACLQLVRSALSWLLRCCR
jgi:hypothetical protein